MQLKRVKAEMEDHKLRSSVSTETDISKVLVGNDINTEFELLTEPHPLSKPLSGQPALRRESNRRDTTLND